MQTCIWSKLYKVGSAFLTMCFSQLIKLLKFHLEMSIYSLKTPLLCLRKVATQFDSLFITKLSNLSKF